MDGLLPFMDVIEHGNWGLGFKQKRAQGVFESKEMENLSVERYGERESTSKMETLVRKTLGVGGLGF